MKPVIYRYREYSTGRLGWYQADIDDAKDCFDAISKDHLIWFEIDKGDGFIWHWSFAGGWCKFKKLTKEQQRKQRELGLKEVFG